MVRFPQRLTTQRTNESEPMAYIPYGSGHKSDLTKCPVTQLLARLGRIVVSAVMSGDINAPNDVKPRCAPRKRGTAHSLQRSAGSGGMFASGPPGPG